MTTTSTPKSVDEITTEIASSARLERRLVRDQARSERRLVKAARRCEEAVDRLSRAQARLAKAESVATERRALLDEAIAAVADAREARQTGADGTERSRTDGQSRPRSRRPESG